MKNLFSLTLGFLGLAYFSETQAQVYSHDQYQQLLARRDNDDHSRIMRDYENQQDPNYRFRNYRNPESGERQAYLNGQIVAPREYPPSQPFGGSVEYYPRSNNSYYYDHEYDPGYGYQ